MGKVVTHQVRHVTEYVFYGGGELSSALRGAADFAESVERPTVSSLTTGVLCTVNAKYSNGQGWFVTVIVKE